MSEFRPIGKVAIRFWRLSEGSLRIIDGNELGMRYGILEKFCDTPTMRYVVLLIVAGLGRIAIEMPPT